METHHPFHQHPLILIEQKEADEQDICAGCVAPIYSSPAYRCTQCKFFLHKSCAELPKQITQLHTQHPLTLVEKSPYESGAAQCDHCGNSIEGFSYHCSICGFDLDPICASIRRVVEHGDHKHSFILLRPTSFTCDVCGEQTTGKSYLCSTCQLWVHTTCASFPHTIKYLYHTHPLKLTYLVLMEEPIDNSIEYFCESCHRKVNINHGFYYCLSCKYILDLKCASRKDLRDDLSVTYNESENSSVETPNHFYPLNGDAREIQLENGQETIWRSHYHQHSLILSNNKPKNPIKCNACVEVISPPFYHCPQDCNFFLHQSCARLPDKTRHPLHEHHLTLSPKPNWRDVIFYCDACENVSNGFCYCCEECRFVLDVRCSIRLREVHLEKGHQHSLRLMTEEKDMNCNACGLRCKKTRFRCAQCDYHVDLRCAALPISVKHKRDVHPLALTYESIEHKNGEYVCDDCEETRNQSHWYYRCEDCERDVHPNCLQFQYVNWMGTYETKVHPHPLSITTGKREFPSCAICSHPCIGIWLHCRECKFNIHIDMSCPGNYFDAS